MGANDAKPPVRDQPGVAVLCFRPSHHLPLCVKASIGIECGWFPQIYLLGTGKVKCMEMANPFLLGSRCLWPCVCLLGEGDDALQI